MDEIYRFRRIENLLGSQQELSKQEIYFAAPEQLNDPMEGYRDIFWRGDQIIWENFLINYLRCVSHVFLLYLIMGEENKLSQNDLPLSPNGLTNITPQSQAIFDKIKAIFFNYSFIRKLPDVLAERASPIRRRELQSYLSFVHQYAINSASEIYFKEGFSKEKLFYHETNEIDKFLSRSHLLAKLVNRLEKKLVGIRNPSDLLFSIADKVRKQYILGVKYNQMTIEQLNSNSNFLLIDFADHFLDKLETLMFSNWYSASFLGNCVNSAIWGHYAENHRGVCLIFSPRLEADKLVLDLTTDAGLRPQNFQKVDYHNKHVEIDFFRSLGRAPLANLNQLWYKNRQGKTSECAEGVGTDEWRKRYWESAIKTYSVKLEEWAYEEEYRLVLNDILHQYTQPSERKLSYNFNQLKGLIFGMKTPLAEKQQIIKIIREKCESNKREQFEFYEAYYDQTTGKIGRYPLNIFEKTTEN